MNVCPGLQIKRNGLWKQIGKFRTIAVLGMSSMFVLPQLTFAEGLDGVGISFDAGYSHDDNVTRASEPAARRSDNALNVNIDVNKSVALTEHSRLALNGFIEAKTYATYGGLDRLSASAGAEYMYRSSGEFGAPTFGIVANAGRDEFRSDLRKSNRYSAGLTLRQPVTSRINLYAALKDNVSRSDNNVFDARDTSAQLNVDYGFNNGNTLYLTTEYRIGDLISTTPPDLGYRQIALAWINDDVFTSGQTLRDYRIKGKTTIITLGYNLPLAGKNSLDISWRFAKSTSDLTPQDDTSPVKYFGNQFSIDYLMGF